MRSREGNPLESPTSRKRLWLLGILLFSLAGVAVWGSSKLAGSKETPASQATVPSVKVSAGDLERIVRLTGATAAVNFAGLTAPQLRGGRRGGGGGPGGGGGGGGPGGGGGGRSFMGSVVLKELAKAGTWVKKGDVVAEFDREDMLQRLDDFKSRVKLAESNMTTIDARLDVTRKAHEQSIRVAKADLDKARLDLKTSPVRSAIATELLRLAVEEAEARYKQILNEVKFMETSLTAQRRIAELDLRETKAEFKRLEANVDKMLVRAPIDGIVVMQSTFRGGEQGQIDKGDQLWPGQPFVQIVDNSSMMINATVNQVDAELIRVGAKARVYFDGYPDLELPATVYGIGAMPRNVGARASYVKEIPVVLRLDKTEARVIPDLSVGVDVVVGAERQALIAPAESIFSDGPGGRPFVFVLSPSGWERREVEVGLSNHVMVAVRSGLSAGDVIARERPVIRAQK